MMEALVDAGIHEQTYLWADDNLSTFYPWDKLTGDQWAYMLAYPNYGRVACLKGLDATSFAFNTGAPPDHWERQMTVLEKLVRSGLDLYVYLVLATPDDVGLDARVEGLLDRLQRIHPHLPLRVYPMKVDWHSPMRHRVRSAMHLDAINKHQFSALVSWQNAMARRFSEAELSRPCYLIELR
jgi:hypothetical protein